MIFHVGCVDDRSPHSFLIARRRFALGRTPVIDGSSPVWTVALLGVIIYCVIQAVRDFRTKRYAWAMAAALSAAVLACMPIEGQKVTIDLPTH